MSITSISTPSAGAKPWFIAVAGSSILRGQGPSDAGVANNNCNLTSALGGGDLSGKQSMIGNGGECLAAIMAWFGHTAVLAGNYAVSGSKILTSGVTNDKTFTEYQLPNCLASPFANMLLVCQGTNDIIDTPSQNQAAFIAEYKAGLLAAKNSGMVVILMTVPPRDTGNLTANTIAFNTEMKSYARANGMFVLDAHAAFADPDGTFRAGFSTDAIHPNSAGAMLCLMAQCEKDLAQLKTGGRSVLNLGPRSDALRLGGLQMVTNGTVPVGTTGIGSVAAELFIPPAAWGDGMEHRGVGTAARYVKRDCPEITEMIATPVVFSVDIEVILNNPTTSTEMEPHVRIQYETSGGAGLGVNIGLLHHTTAPNTGWYNSLPRTRLSVLVWLPPLSGQISGGTIAKMVAYIGNNSTGAGFSKVRYSGIDTWVLGTP